MNGEKGMAYTIIMLLFLFLNLQAADEYIRYDIKTDKADSGYPRAISQSNWPGLWPNGINAVLNWDDLKAYFFPLSNRRDK